MQIIETPIKDLLVLEPRVFEDDRGYFFESYNKETLQKLGLNHNYIQDNEAYSQYGVVRGLHYQLAPFAQTKLVRVIKGKVFDVAVDLRKGSPTFGQWHGIELSEENKRQFLVPRGFAHGYAVLSKSAIFAYKCDNVYHKESEQGISINDPDLQIDWQIPEKDQIISEKDKNQPLFKNATYNFTY